VDREKKILDYETLNKSLLMFTPTNITAPQDLFNEATEYHNLIKDPFSTDDASACMIRASDLGAWMARTGKMLADARYWKDEAMKGSILKQVGAKLPTSTLNDLIKAECKDINYLVNL
jgi:hypothetical protein